MSGSLTKGRSARTVEAPSRSRSVVRYIFLFLFFLEVKQKRCRYAFEGWGPNE